MWRDVELVSAHEPRPKDAVDVLRQTHALVVERLALQGCREEPAQGRPADEEDPGARHEEDMQQRDRAMERPAAGIRWTCVKGDLVLGPAIGRASG